MKKISAKIIIAVLLLTAISLSSFAMLSFSLADENNGASVSTAVFAESNSYTQVDRIIENSINGNYGDKSADENKIYNIVEITSKGSSSLETLISNGVFKDYVIDGHRSIQDLMAAGTVKYQSFVASSSADDQIAAIQNADLIYVHNDPDGIYSDAAGTDIQEEVKLALSTAATGDHKPFIIDSYKGTIDNITAANTYNSLVSRVFNTSLCTYAWPNGASIEQFMKMQIVSAFYTRVKGDSAKSNWTTDNKAKILRIGTGDLKAKMTDADLQNYAYVKAESSPEGFEWTEVEATADLSSYDLGSYDFIVLESGCDNVNISDDNFTAIAAAAYSKVHILFSPSLQTSASGGTSSGSNPASAYAYVLEKVATTSDTPKFGNVLVTNFSKMNIYANANRAKTVDDIANIIIKGSFRGVNGTDSGDDTSNVYTVLEIEPAYPIDTNLAKAFYDNKTYDLNDNEFNGNMSFIDEKFAGKGKDVLFNKYRQTIFYYLRTNSVIDGSTEDEISFDGQTPLSMYEDYDTYKAAVLKTQTDNNSNLKDYYRWRISQAKIAHATGLDYNQVKVIHMSSAQFNTNREALDGAYDAIYIGGDTSSMKPQNKWDNGGKYLMYFRDGDNNKTVSTSNGTYRSNDISNDKKDELIAYAGSLPVIIDSEVVSAIENGIGVDPDSNMGKAISAIKNGEHTLYGFDSSKTVKIFNNENQYGSTYGGIVTVFAGSKAKGAGYDTDDCEVFAKNQADFDSIDFGNQSSNEDALSDILTSAQRLKLSVTTPKEYVETDSSTWITKDDFNFKYNINGASSSDNIAVNLYIDDNGDGRFEDDEIRYTTSGSSGEFNPKDDDNWIGDDFFGPVYWKLIVTDSVSKTSTSTTGLSKVKRTNQDKLKVKLLQIIPETADQRGSDNSHSTLYLCTECQMAKRIMHGNLSVSNNQGRYGQGTTDGLQNGYTDGWSGGNISGSANTILSLTGNTNNNNNNNLVIPDNASFIYKQPSNGWYYQTGSVAKGGSTVIKGCKPGDQLTINVVYNWNDGDYSLKAISGSSSIVVKGNEVNINVASDGIVKIDYPDPEAKTDTDEEKDYKYIIDYLTNDDENYSYTSYGNDLGIHENKFGIVKYDAHEKRYNGNQVYQEGYDKFTTNWFLDFQGDYDVETTILDIPKYTAYINNVESIYSDIVGNREAVASKRKTFDDDAKKYYRLYQSVRKLINGYSLDQIDDPDTEDVNEKDELIEYLNEDMKIGADFTNGTLTYKFDSKNTDDVETMLKAYSGAATNIDNYLKNNRESIYNNNKQHVNCRKEEYDTEIDFYLDESIEPTMRSYYLFFSLWSDQNEDATPTFAKYYVVWRDAKILEQYLFHEYKENELYASVYYEDQYDDSLIGKFNLKNSFSCVALGCAENFNGQDITDEDACYAIKNYADDNGSVLLFHDSLCPSGVSYLGNGTPTMTRILAESFGQGGVSDSTTKKDGLSVTQKTLQMYCEGHEADSLEYIAQQTNNLFNAHSETDNQFLHTAHDVREFYADANKDVGADAANRVNKGIITTYPFTIDDTLKISPTNANGFTANTDDKDMVVYYTIAGGSLGTSSSAFVANPSDGANNYFLYQYHNVTYTGAGHASITGKGRDNNDERRLFINVILNSARPSTAGPDLTCHDYTSTDDKQTNSVIQETHAKELNGLVEDKEEYVTYVASDDETPIFSFMPKAPAGIKSIKIWYDVANDGNEEKNVYNESTGNNSGYKDVLIYEIDSSIASNNENNLYFETTNVDSEGNVSYSNERYSLVGDATSLDNDHVASGKVKHISDETTKVRLKGYTFNPILDASGNYTYQKNADGSYTTETRNGIEYRIPLGTHYSNLKLNPDYFTGKNGKCTYICVQMTDNNNKKVTRTIRVEFKPDLLDLN